MSDRSQITLDGSTEPLLVIGDRSISSEICGDWRSGLPIPTAVTILTKTRKEF
ncbi:hypothetical protein [Chamaesiphon sp. VAR_69_metabat_338]|uniref:hypothetical protein n=1 Tax=Chamaesiphon sp. VAR_69_metabat_338 TaxID=2964704 RepID=UPI00286EA563|nr:hypothetical protein [Chamaesiphon sp. VAR_69_metabat_338]